MINRFFAKRDFGSLFELENIFSDKGRTWLFEDPHNSRWVAFDNDHICLDGYDYSKTNPSGKWVTGLGGSGKHYCKYDQMQFTSDKEKAMRFDTEGSALAYIVKNQLGRLGFEPTPYPFTNSLQRW